MATSAVVRAHAGGEDIDHNAMTALVITQTVGESHQDALRAHDELVVAARAAGRLGILHFEKLTSSRLGRFGASMEIGFSRLFDPYARSAEATGIPQQTALAVATQL